jgi:hypothetical protein
MNEYTFLCNQQSVASKVNKWANNSRQLVRKRDRKMQKLNNGTIVGA